LYLSLFILNYLRDLFMRPQSTNLFSSSSDSRLSDNDEFFIPDNETDDTVPLLERRSSLEENISPHDIILIPEQEPNDKYDVCCESVRPFRPVLFLIGPIPHGLVAAADVSCSLSLTTSIHLFNVYAGGVLAFLSTIGLTGKPVKENFDISCGI